MTFEKRGGSTCLSILGAYFFGGGHYREGGGEVQAYFGKAKFGAVKFWYKILDTMGKCGTIFP